MGEHETDARDRHDRKERVVAEISPSEYLAALERSFCKPFETSNEVQL
jgi:hypothetical protein